MPVDPTLTADEAEIQLGILQEDHSRLQTIMEYLNEQATQIAQQHGAKYTEMREMAQYLQDKRAEEAGVPNPLAQFAPNMPAQPGQQANFGAVAPVPGINVNTNPLNFNPLGGLPNVAGNVPAAGNVNPFGGLPGNVGNAGAPVNYINRGAAQAPIPVAGATVPRGGQVGGGAGAQAGRDAGAADEDDEEQ